MGCSPVFQVHATDSRVTLDLSIDVRGEYLSPPASPPYTGHSLGLREPAAIPSSDPLRRTGGPDDRPHPRAVASKKASARAWRDARRPSVSPVKPVNPVNPVTFV